MWGYRPRPSAVDARLVALVAVSAALAGACSVVTDLDGLAPTPAAAGGGGGGAGGYVAGSGGQGGEPTDCDCVPDVPSGWSGPYSLATIAGDVSAFRCADGLAATTYHSEPPGPHACTACACAPPTATCTPNALTCFSQTNCMGSAVDATGSDGCGAPIQGVSCLVGDATLGSGSCDPSGGEPTNLATWGASHHLCVAPAVTGGCPTGSSCAQPGACVAHGGHSECPAEYPEPLLVWSDAVDTRACSSCTCSPASGTCMDGGYHVADNFLLCSAYPTTPPGACVNIGNSPVYAEQEPATPVATCDPSRATPNGAFEPDSPVTICCRAASD